MAFSRGIRDKMINRSGGRCEATGVEIGRSGGVTRLIHNAVDGREPDNMLNT